MSIGDIIKNCEYARIATHTDLNPINWGDAEGFFMEGMEYQRRLQESQLAANANMVLVEDERHDQLLAAEVRIAELERILADPASVWANMLTGKIARPQALDHYEECKQMVEKLDEQVRVLRKAVNAALSADSDKWVEHLENALAATEGLDNAQVERRAPSTFAPTPGSPSSPKMRA